VASESVAEKLGSLAGIVRRQYQNITIFHAFSWLAGLENLITFPIDRFLRRDGSACLPLTLGVMVTQRCNLRCKMCKVTGLLTRDGSGEPTLAQLDKFFAELAPGRTHLGLCGGEPLLRRDLGAIAAAARRRRLSAGIFTNGVLLDPDMADQLTEAGLSYVAVSLLGDRAEHNRLAAAPNAYDLLVRNLRYLARNRKQTRVVIHCTLSPVNLGAMDEVMRLAEELDLDFVRFGHPTWFTPEDARKSRAFFARRFPGERIGALAFDYQPRFKTEQVVAAVRAARRRYGGRIGFQPELTDSEVRGWYGGEFRTQRPCLFVFRGGIVRANGDLTCCESLDYVIGNVYRDGFRGVWNNARYRTLRNQLKQGLFPACARCCKL